MARRRGRLVERASLAAYTDTHTQAHPPTRAGVYSGPLQCARSVGVPYLPPPLLVTTPLTVYGTLVHPEPWPLDTM